jgi:hypothetical protein
MPDPREEKIIIDSGLIQTAAECIGMAARGELSHEQIEAMIELDKEWLRRTKSVMRGADDASHE